MAQSARFTDNRMARRKSGRAVRQGKGQRMLRWLAALVLLGLIGGGIGWWHLRHWQPDTTAYPVQGLEVSSADGPLDWPAIKAVGADFAYLDASVSVFARDPAFSKNWDEARAAHLQVGAVHRYDPCQPADKQAGNFVLVVPRDAKMLPPAVDLDMLADDCPVKTGDAKVESELMTFINQIETHTGKPVLLKISTAFEQRYHLAHMFNRNLWLSRDRFEPGYAGRPWMLWTANAALDTEISDQPLHWVVAQP